MCHSLTNVSGSITRGLNEKTFRPLIPSAFRPPLVQFLFFQRPIPSVPRLEPLLLAVDLLFSSCSSNVRVPRLELLLLAVDLLSGQSFPPLACVSSSWCACVCVTVWVHFGSPFRVPMIRVPRIRVLPPPQNPGPLRRPGPPPHFFRPLLFFRVPPPFFPGSL